MYQIKCDGYVLYDPRDEDLVVKNPKCKLAVNTVGEASFTILANHMYYDRLNKLRSVFEIIQDGEAIFRGRMTDDSKDFHNKKQVDLEGAMAYFNDSMMRPFAFPDDFLQDAEYLEAAQSGNVVAFFLGWIISTHNSQVQPFQRFKLGRVTVTDPNNYLSRSETSYKKSWEILKEKLFESSLGGYLCIRYEADGNYIDYLAEFDTDNSQKIVFGENLLDILVDSDATETYSAIIPLGADEETEKDAASTRKLAIADLPDGDITDDIVKKGDTLYSKSAVAAFGWIYAPVSETTWDAVTTVNELRDHGVDFLENKATKFWETVTIKAIDLHLSNQKIEAIRIYKKVNVDSAPHGRSGKENISELDIDIENPQNTKITVGETKRVLTDKTNAALHQVETVKKDNSKTNADLSNKVSKTDDAQIIEMLNRANTTASTAVAKFLGNRLVIESDNFTLSEEGSVVARDITIENNDGIGDYSVKISDGVILVDSPMEHAAEGTQQIIDLMHFNIKAFGVYRLSILVEYWEDLKWHFLNFIITPVE